MSHRHGPHCGCPKRIVYPVKQNCVHHCTESVVEHVHPSHTTVMNHHLVKNMHVYPHSTSVENTVDSVDINAGAFNVPYPPQPTPGIAPNQVAGAMDPGNPGMNLGMGPGNQVAGAMDPGKPGYPGMGYGYPPAGMKHWQKPNKWC